MNLSTTAATAAVLTAVLLPHSLNTPRPATASAANSAPAQQQNHEHGAHAGEQHDHDSEPGHGSEQHDDHEHDAPGEIELSPAVIDEFGIEIRTASPGTIAQSIRLPGEVRYNADRVARVTPSVKGVVTSVRASVGDRVERGGVMAVLSSRELAAARSEYSAARARLQLAERNRAAKERLYGSRTRLAEENLQRDRRLFEDKVGSERDVIESEQALDEARVSADLAATEARQAITEAEIALEEAETALHAIGFTHEQIETIDSLEHEQLNEFELTTPISGIVTRRDLTVGDVVSTDGGQTPFVVADLTSVWIDLTVYQRNLTEIDAGQAVSLRFRHGIPDAEGEIAFVSPEVDEATRTATARVVLQNPDGHWRPGLFLDAEVSAGQSRAQVVVPPSAVIGLDGRQAVFIATDHGFRAQTVVTGQATDDGVVITSGLNPGDRYAATGAVTLKAQLNSAALKHAGHAH